MSSRRLAARIAATATLACLAVACQRGTGDGGEKSREAESEPVSRPAKGSLRVLWKQAVRASQLGPSLALCDDRLFLSSAAELSMFSLDGRPLGSFKSPAGKRLSPPVAVNCDLIATTDVASVYGVDRDGRVRWTAGWPSVAPRAEDAQPVSAVASNDGVSYWAGPDGKLHAFTANGDHIWSVDLGTRAGSKRVFPVAVGPGRVLVVAEQPSRATEVVVVDTKSSPPERRGSLQVGKAVWRVLADQELGVVVTGYVETTSRRGRTRVVAFATNEQKRWEIDRGRHDLALATTAQGGLVVASQDVSNPADVSDIELWSNGSVGRRAPLKGTANSAVIGDDGIVYVVGCDHGVGNVTALDPRLDEVDRLELGPGCFGPAKMARDGQLVAARATGDETGPRTEIVAIATPSRHPAEKGWAMSSADPRGSGSFELASR
jgi:hypothetical protein